MTSLPTASFQPRDATERGEEGSPLRGLLLILRRRSWLIFWVVFLLTTIAVLVGLQITKTYTAMAHVMIEPRLNRVVNIEAVTQGFSANDRAAMETQIKVIQSRRTLERAAEKLGLLAGSSPPASDAHPGWLRRIIDDAVPEQWLIAAGIAREAPAAGDPDPPDEDPDDRRARAVGQLQGGLVIGQLGASYILSVAYTSIIPHEAARFANAIAHAYVEDQLGGKIAATEHAHSWLTGRVEQLQQGVIEAESGIEEYRSIAGLVDSASTTLVARQFGAISGALMDARAESLVKDARLRRLRMLREGRGSYASSADVLSSPVIMSLRQQELDLLRDEAQVAREFGGRHPRTLQVEADKQRLAARIDQEVQNVIVSLQDEVEVVRIREQALQERLEEAEDATAAAGRAEVGLRQLEREASARRSLYETFLARLKETEEQLQILQPDAQVISSAQVPEVPDSVSPLQFGVGGFAMSFVIGTMVALFMEQLDNSIRSRRQVEDSLHVPAWGLVPEIELGWGQRPHLYLIEKPRSSYSESIRGLYVQASLADADCPPKLLMVTSALPGEGKTTLSVSLAAFAASGMGKRVLLVDFDFRAPSISRQFLVEPKASIAQLLNGEVSLDEAIYRDEATGVDIVSGGGRGHSNPTRLLTSDRIAAVLQEARERYDLVVIDTPPVLGITDAQALVLQVDATLFVIQWDKTKLDAAKSALKELASAPPRLIAAVVTRVDLKKHAAYRYGDGYHYYSKYKHYYVD